MCKNTRRSCGFRFSFTDAIVIVLCILGFYLLWKQSSWLAGKFCPYDINNQKIITSRIRWASIILPVVVTHFFLFCNVFRIRRSYELIWSSIFIVNILFCQQLSLFHWGIILAIQIPVTASLIIMEMLSSQYHGILSRKINSNIEKYLGR